MRLLLIGAPGSGKGTQAKFLKEQLGVGHISTGDLLRKAVADVTVVGLKAQSYMVKGELVPDSVIIEVLEEALRRPEYAKGFLLDGYPRNLNQAKTLDQLLAKLHIQLDKVLYFQIPFGLLEERLVGRRVSEKTGTEYHIKFKPPKMEGICDIDGSKLIHRPDDYPDKVRTRLKVFETETLPVVQFYQDLGLVRTIQSDRKIAEVAQQIAQAIGLNA